MKRGDAGYWEWRKKVGKPKAIQTPEKLWELACEYFQSVEDTPFVKEELIKGGMFAGDKGRINLQAPYTWYGLEAYLFEKGIIGRLDEYKRNVTGSYEEYQDVLCAIENEMRQRNLGGAAAGVFNSNTIAAIHGLAKKVEQTITVEQPLFPEDSTGKNILPTDETSLLD